MKKTNFFEAVRKFKKGANTRNLKLFTTQVEKTINDEIRKRESAIEDLKSELEQRKEEKEIDLTDTLLSVDESRMENVDSRKSYAAQYVVSAISAINQYENDIEGLEYNISSKEEEIGALKKLAKKLTEVQPSIEEIED